MGSYDIDEHGVKALRAIIESIDTNLMLWNVAPDSSVEDAIKNARGAAIMLITRNYLAVLLGEPQLQPHCETMRTITPLSNVLN